MTAREREYYEAGLRGHVHGTEEQVRAALERVVAETGADELLVTTSTYDRVALRDSFRRLARLAGLRPPSGGEAG
jgi:alkanesulfonate monooxygenase SsuD/methylene tetrahydromethanopterin reductase-like flavin-dependent oxidoreductase (luciferase family)